MKKYWENQEISDRDRQKHVEMVKKSFPKSTESGLDKVKEESMKELQLRVEDIMALLQGKELHYNNELVIYPPQGNITMTKEQFDGIKRKAQYEAANELLDVMDSIRKDNEVRLEIGGSNEGLR